MSKLILEDSQESVDCEVPFLYRIGHNYLTPPKLKRPKPLRKRFEKFKISRQNYFYWAKTWLQFCKERDTPNSNGVPLRKSSFDFFFFAGGGSNSCVQYGNASDNFFGGVCFFIMI